MTTFEISTLVMSGIALLISILSPFVTYHLLDPQIKAFRNRARLKSDSRSYLGTDMQSKDGKPVGVSVPIWELAIENTGSLPANAVEITLFYQRYKDPETGLEETHPLPVSADDVNLRLFPPFRYEISNRGSEFSIVLSQPIAPGGQLVMKALEPDLVWVSNEFGEKDLIQTSAGLKRQFDHAPYFPLGHRAR